MASLAQTPIMSSLLQHPRCVMRPHVIKGVLLDTPDYYRGVFYLTPKVSLWSPHIPLFVTLTCNIKHRLWQLHGLDRACNLHLLSDYQLHNS